MFAISPYRRPFDGASGAADVEISVACPQCGLHCRVSARRLATGTAFCCPRGHRLVLDGCPGLAEVVAFLDTIELVCGRLGRHRATR